jgi:hypothetical protein
MLPGPVIGSPRIDIAIRDDIVDVPPHYPDILEFTSAQIRQGRMQLAAGSSFLKGIPTPRKKANDMSPRCRLRQFDRAESRAHLPNLMIAVFMRLEWQGAQSRA